MYNRYTETHIFIFRICSWHFVHRFGWCRWIFSSVLPFFPFLVVPSSLQKRRWEKIIEKLFRIMCLCCVCNNNMWILKSFRTLIFTFTLITHVFNISDYSKFCPKEAKKTKNPQRKWALIFKHIYVVAWVYESTNMM